MNNQTGNRRDVPAIETSRTLPATNHCFPEIPLTSSTNFDTSPHGLEYYNEGLNTVFNEPIKYLNYQRMLFEQGNEMMALKVSEYDQVLAEKDCTIKSLHSDMMNSKNRNYIITNQYKNLLDKTNSVSEFCAHLNTSFTSICDRLNSLGETVHSARTRQTEVTELVNKTIKEFQEKNLNLAACKTNLEEFTNQIENLKSENALLLEKLKKLNEEKETTFNLNQTFEKELKVMEDENVFLTNQNKSINAKYNEIQLENQSLTKSLKKLNEEYEITFNLNQTFEKELKVMEDKNVFLVDQNKSINTKCDEIQLENQSLINEHITMKNSLDETKKILDDQLSKIKEQQEIIDNLKTTEELNYTLKKDNFILKERNECLEKINTNLMDDIMTNNNNSVNKIEKDNIHKDFDDLLKVQEAKLIDVTQKLEFQTEKENKLHSEISDLKQEVEMCKNRIISLQEKVKANNILIPELQNEIDILSTKLVESNQKLEDSSKEFLAKKNAIEKDKNKLENHNTLHLKKIEQLQASYIKYRLKTKQLYVLVQKIHSQYSQSVEKKTHLPQLLEAAVGAVLDLNDREEISKENVSMQPSTSIKANIDVFDFNDRDEVSKENTSILQSTSIRVNQSYSNLKNNVLSMTPIDNSSMKKRRPDDDSPTLQKKTKPTNEQRKVWTKPNSPIKLTTAPLK